MKKNNDQNIELLARYIEGQCDAEEQSFIEAAYDKYTQQKSFKQATDIDFEGIGIQTWNEIAGIINRKESKRSKRKHFFTAAACAALLMIGTFIYRNSHTSHIHFSLQTADNTHSSDNDVTLVLGNGQSISMENTDTGNIAQQQGTALRKTSGNTLMYSSFASSDRKAIVYNTLKTSRGKQYSIILQDGTFVRLNASSSLKYPTSFNGKERVVELSGEAYFEVAHNGKIPFKVKLKDEEVEDIGTHFNINAYPDEKDIQTTLLEGSVRINTKHNHTILQPGELSVCTDGVILKKYADTSLVMAWNNGYFKFKNDDIQSVMRQLARWYNINVYYDNEIPVTKFGAILSRKNSISQVLDLLASTGKVHFKVTGNDVHVTL